MTDSEIPENTSNQLLTHRKKQTKKQNKTKQNKPQKLRHNQTSVSVMFDSSDRLKNLNLPFF